MVDRNLEAVIVIVLLLRLIIPDVESTQLVCHRGIIIISGGSDALLSLLITSLRQIQWFCHDVVVLATACGLSKSSASIQSWRSPQLIDTITKRRETSLPQISDGGRDRCRLFRCRCRCRCPFHICTADAHFVALYSQYKSHLQERHVPRQRSLAFGCRTLFVWTVRWEWR